MTSRTSTLRRFIGPGVTVNWLLRTAGPAPLKAERGRAQERPEATAAGIIVVSGAILIALLAAVLGSVDIDHPVLPLLALLPIVALILVSVPALNRRAVAFWSPRKQASSQDRPHPSGMSDSSPERPSAHETPEASAPIPTPPRLGPDQVITLTQDFERAIARQQESTLQLIRRQEQVIGDLTTLVRILQERVLIQQAQLEALGAPAAADDRALSELIDHLPFGDVSMDQMLRLSDQLNERLHRPPFGSDHQ